MNAKQALLIQRTAWMQIRLADRTPTAEDERCVPIAIEMLTYIACLDYAMLDLEAELTAAGMFRHQLRRRFNQARVLVEQAHGKAFEVIHTVDPQASRQYNDKMDEAYQRINECVLLAAPERGYNVVLSLCRLIETLNGRISGRYDFNPAKPLYHIPALLKCELQDYRIERIIEQNQH